MQLGCGLFGLAFELEQDFWGTLQKLSRSGYTAVEPLFAFKNDPALQPGSPITGFLKTILWDEPKVMEYLPRLKELDLEISSMHVGFQFGMTVEEGIPQLVEFSKRSGVTHFMTSLEFGTPQATDDAITLMNRAYELLSGTGVTLGYHNHYQEFSSFGSETHMNCFLKNTHPEIKLQLDTGWQMYGGSNVIDFIKKYPHRLSSIHLKDFAADFSSLPKEEAFTAIGDGVLPTKEILSLLPTLNMINHGLMIDQDRPAKGHILSDDLNRGAAYLSALLD